MSTKNPILESVYETASDLQKLGFINAKRLSEYKELCIDPSMEFSPERIRKIRSQLNVSQVALATFINVSPSAVRKWEQGDKNPSGPAKRILDLLERKGLSVLI